MAFDPVATSISFLASLLNKYPMQLNSGHKSRAQHPHAVRKPVAPHVQDPEEASVHYSLGQSIAINYCPSTF